MSIFELTLIVGFLALVVYLIWRAAGWAAGHGRRVVAGFFVFWILTTIVGAIVFVAMVSIQQRRARRAAAEPAA